MAAFKPQSPLEVFTRVAPSLVNSQGQWTPFNAAAQLYSEVEIRTNATPPFTLNVAELGAPSPGPNPVASALQPTIILRGPLGQRTLAPYGVADGTTGTVVSFGFALGIAGALGTLGFFAGSWRERRRQRRQRQR